MKNISKVIILIISLIFISCTQKEIVYMQPVTLTLNGDTHFQTDSARLRSYAKGLLANKIHSLNVHEITNITIVGHTDSRGSESYNRILSERRANSVKNYFISLGVSRYVINTIGMGESEPIADNSTVSGRASNRRVEISIQFQ